MSPPIQPYTLSPHQAGCYVGQSGTVCYPDDRSRRTKVAIWGFGSDSRRRVPFDDPSFVIWSINNAWNAARDREGRLRADAWWEQHQITPDALGSDAGRPIQDRYDMEWLDTCPVPIYVTEPWPRNPNAVVWPIDVMAAKYRDYFTCTFAMQLAQAIEEGFAEIHLFGLALLNGTKREATVESSCLNYWLGLAEGHGIRLVIDPADWLLLGHPYRYGHQYWLERRWVEGYCARWDARPVAV